MRNLGTARIGTAGWAIPTAFKKLFSEDGSHLEKYAKVFNCVELNSCFYREHKTQTYLKWANSTPADFQFSLKLLKYFTHEKKLTETGPYLKQILEGHKCLEQKWGALVVQLPPSLAFDVKTAQVFFGFLRENYDGLIFCEPRHQSWVSETCLNMFAQLAVSKIIADPEPCPTHLKPQDQYFRLHGSPEIYKSAYTTEFMKNIARQMQDVQKPCWCIFDNTTFGFSIFNALEMQKILLQPTIDFKPEVLR